MKLLLVEFNRDRYMNEAGGKKSARFAEAMAIVYASLEETPTAAKAYWLTSLTKKTGGN